MPTPILNFGSLNIDYVYGVPHFVRPGETLTADSFERYAGGKGLNQSIALARAGATVRHAGAIGSDGGFLADTLAAEGIDLTSLQRVATPTGHAIIQTHRSGENCILLHGGANVALSPEDIDRALATLPAGSFVLTQNETNVTADVLLRAKNSGFRVVWNPAPITPDSRSIPLESVDILVLNEIEGAELSGESAPDAILHALGQRIPHGMVVLTLGADGSIARIDGETLLTAAAPVEQLLDTTAAGDTFIGYFLAGIANEKKPADAVNFASRAAALCVQRRGAAPSIPRAAELERA